MVRARLTNAQVNTWVVDILKMDGREFAFEIFDFLVFWTDKYQVK